MADDFASPAIDFADNDRAEPRRALPHGAERGSVERAGGQRDPLLKVRPDLGGDTCQFSRSARGQVGHGRALKKSPVAPSGREIGR